jgi:uncharacterized protein
MKTTICIFARPPVPGKSKTRLIPTLGEEGAALVAKALLADTVTAAIQVERANVILSVPEVFEFGQRLPMWLQPEGDLGMRVERTLQRALAASDCAVAVGADTPGLTSTMLEEAIEQLRHKDAVVGPTEDGGYYLLGLRRCPESLLRNIRWSSRDTLCDTLEQFEKFSFDYTTVPKWFDLDTGNDLVRARALMRSNIFVGSRLALALHALSAPSQVLT